MRIPDPTDNQIIALLIVCGTILFVVLIIASAIAGRTL